MINIMEPQRNHTSQNLMYTCRFFNSTATEFQKLKTADKNPVVLNVPGRLSLELVKSRILKFCRMTHHGCTCIRLMENVAPQRSSFSYFQVNLRLKDLPLTVKLMPETLGCKIKIFTDKRPLQKEGFCRSKINHVYSLKTLPLP